MTTSLFVKRAFRVLSRPAPAPLAAPPAIVVQAPQWIPPTPIPLGPKSPDVEDIPTQFRFGMQQVTVAMHATSDAPAKFPASLVGGR